MHEKDAQYSSFHLLCVYGFTTFREHLHVVCTCIIIIMQHCTHVINARDCWRFHKPTKTDFWHLCNLIFTIRLGTLTEETELNPNPQYRFSAVFHAPQHVGAPRTSSFKDAIKLLPTSLSIQPCRYSAPRRADQAQGL